MQDIGLFGICCFAPLFGFYSICFFFIHVSLSFPRTLGKLLGTECANVCVCVLGGGSEMIFYINSGVSGRMTMFAPEPVLTPHPLCGGGDVLSVLP